MTLIEIFKSEDDYLSLLKNKQIHMVTPAFMGLTQCSAYLEFGCNMKQIEQEVYVMRVNENWEVGTLYPRHNMTLFPYRLKTRAFMSTGVYDYTDRKGYSDNDFRDFISDIIKAEIQYVKSKRLIIDVAGSLDNTEKMRFFSLLRKEVELEKNKNVNLTIEFKWDW